MHHEDLTRSGSESSLSSLNASERNSFQCRLQHQQIGQQLRQDQQQHYLSSQPTTMNAMTPSQHIPPRRNSLDKNVGGGWTKIMTIPSSRRSSATNNNHANRSYLTNPFSPKPTSLSSNNSSLKNSRKSSLSKILPASSPSSSSFVNDRRKGNEVLAILRTVENSRGDDNHDSITGDSNGDGDGRNSTLSFSSNGGNKDSTNYNIDPADDEDQYNNSDHSIIKVFAIRQYPNGDLFSGNVNARTKELIYGRMTYALDMEIYEGPFWKGLRHGDGAVCMKMNGAGKFLGRLVFVCVSNACSLSGCRLRCSLLAVRFFAGLLVCSILGECLKRTHKRLCIFHYYFWHHSLHPS